MYLSTSRHGSFTYQQIQIQKISSHYTDRSHQKGGTKKSNTRAGHTRQTDQSAVDHTRFSQCEDKRK